MVRHLSTGTATIVALMAAHRRAQEEPDGSHTLDDFFRQEAASFDDYIHTPDRLNRPKRVSQRKTQASSRMAGKRAIIL
jgi:hypothetical protein